MLHSKDINRRPGTAILKPHTNKTPQKIECYHVKDTGNHYNLWTTTGERIEVPYWRILRVNRGSFELPDGDTND